MASRYGEIPKRVGREKAAKILAVQPIVDNLGARQPVPATGTHRRIQALVARRWSISHLGRTLGWEPGIFHAMLQRDQVGAATHRDVAAA